MISTKDRNRLVELSRERDRMEGIPKGNPLQRLGVWLVLKGIHWQIKGILKRNT
jgi:hypothetical protein